MNIIESSLNESRVFLPQSAFSKDARIKTMQAYQEMCDLAEEDHENYWGKKALDELSWFKPFTKILDESSAPFYRWFDDGLLNASYNCIDKNIENGNGEKIAILFEADSGESYSVTFNQLYKKVCKLANAIKKLGFIKGDVAVIYMPMSVEGIIAMQACARLGIIHSVVFGGFSAKSLQERILDVGASLIFTADEQVRGGKNIPLKVAVDEALSIGGCNAVKKVIIYERTGATIKFNAERDLWMHDLISVESEVCEPVWVEADHPLFVLYTSGSTGKPKGIQHSTAGYLLHSILTMKYTFDIKELDIFWCTADIGWITGHTYVAYGPIATGATQIIFEGIPSFPDAGRFWEIIENYKVTIFYTAPTAIRSLIKAVETNKDTHPDNFNLSSLRLLGSVGEPINPEAWIWYFENIGRKNCPIVDTFWQTETGGHIITPMPGATPLVPGSCTLPFPGIDVGVVDDNGNDLPNGKGGMLVIKKPWPSMIRTIWGDPDRFISTYFPSELGGKLYLAGDSSIRDEKTGYFTIMGRIDDVLNVSGHRMGTMEIESALVSNDIVAEAAVVGRPDDLTGEAIVAFVVLKGISPSVEDEKIIALDLRQWVGKQIGPIAKPKEIRFGDNLPKTRSGKIMRRLLRLLANSEEITQDISTLENPAILEQLKKAR